MEWLQIDIQDRAAYDGTPEAGLSAILAAAYFVHLLKNEFVSALAQRYDPVLSPDLGVRDIKVINEISHVCADLLPSIESPRGSG